MINVEDPSHALGMTVVGVGVLETVCLCLEAVLISAQYVGGVLTFEAFDAKRLQMVL